MDYIRLQRFKSVKNETSIGFLSLQTKLCFVQSDQKSVLMLHTNET